MPNEHLFICFRSMPNGDDNIHQQRIIVDRVQNTVVSDSYTPQIVTSSEFPTAERAGRFAQCFDFVNYPRDDDAFLPLTSA